MSFFEPALQTTVSFYGLPVILLACFITLVVTLIRRRRGVRLTVGRFAAYFLITTLLCFALTLVGNWLFLLVAVENTQGF